MKVIICGDRNWTDRELIRRHLILLQGEAETIDIIHGDCRGADRLAGSCAVELMYNCRSVPAEWDRYHSAAGPIRNAKMLELNPDLVLAFHDNLELSKGTRNMIHLAEAAGVEVRKISHVKENKE